MKTAVLKFDKRKDDKCVMKKLYREWTPYTQLGGWLVMIMTIIFTAGMIWENAQASIKDVGDLKLWKDSVAPDIAAMKQEIHDIHEAVVGQ